MGVSGKLLSWIECFLQNRSQKVKIDNEFSHSIFLSSGVVQGSVTGPLFFLCYINNLPSVIKTSQIYLFADDAKLSFVHGKNKAKCADFQQDLNAILSWAESRQLKLSLSKCQVLNLGSSKSCKNIRNPNSYHIGQELLPSVNSVRDLGIEISNTLNFHQHCSTLTLKANQKTNLIFRTFETRNKNFLIQMYKTFVRPKLEYATPVWSPYHKMDIELIESVQKNFTRRLPEFRNDNYQPYLQRLKSLKLESLELRRLKNDILFLHKIIYGHLNVDSKDFVIVKNFSTRSNGLKLQKSHCRLDVRKFYFGNRVVDFWNCLPEILVCIQEHGKFSNMLSTLILSNSLPELTKFLKIK